MLPVALLIAALVAFFHFASGSSHSELGAHPDEAAHFVTGLMVRDYILHGLPHSPLAFADQYYRHYPKIGLGVWPPFFYLVQALWTLIFPVGVATVLRLMALLTVALALLTAWWLRREFSWVESISGATLLIALPLVQQYSNMVMAEILSSLLMFAAAGYFARILEGAEWPGAIGFGVCAGLAIMTKGTGVALALLPAFAILFTRRFDLLKRRSLWVAALLVAVIAGPWTWHFRKMGLGGWEEPKPSLHFTARAIGFYGNQLIVALGALLMLLAIAGAVSLFLPRIQKPAIAICSLSLVLSVWIFQCITPVGLEARHLTPAMPALIILAMTGLHALTGRQSLPVRASIAAALLALFFAWPAIVPPATPLPGYGSIGNGVALSPFRIPSKQWHGFQPIADFILASDPRTVTLVASDARGEGMLIADVAARDPHRPSFTIQRASKILASSTWSGSGYQSLYTTPAQVRDALALSQISLVVTDASLSCSSRRSPPPAPPPSPLPPRSATVPPSPPPSNCTTPLPDITPARRCYSIALSS
jgi:hypothetical protein